jgi:hypothetical protein
MMAENYDPVPDLAEMLVAALSYQSASMAVSGYRVTERLGIGKDDSAEVVVTELRKALGLKACLCGITPGAPSEVIPVACPVHGTPCEDCGGVETCKPGCGDGYAPVDSGTDSDGTPWGIAASGSGLTVSVGTEDVLLKGGERDRFAEAVARAVTPGQAAGTEDGCPIEAVLPDGHHPCTLKRGHAEYHDFAQEPTT